MGTRPGRPTNLRSLRVQRPARAEGSGLRYVPPTSPPTLCMVRLGWLALALLFLLSARLLGALSSPCSFGLSARGSWLLALLDRQEPADGDLEKTATSRGCRMSQRVCTGSGAKSRRTRKRPGRRRLLVLVPNTRVHVAKVIPARFGENHFCMKNEYFSRGWLGGSAWAGWATVQGKVDLLCQLRSE